MKPIPNFPGYFATKNGRIWSAKRVDRLGRRYGGYYLRPGRNGGGYFFVNLSIRGIRHVKMIHTLVLLAFRGIRPAGFVSRHLDNNKHNNRADNLEWTHPSVNSQDRVKFNSLKGERNGSNILTNKQVLYIKKHLGKIPVKGLAEKFNVARETIYNIKHGTRWGWLKCGM